MITSSNIIWRGMTDRTYTFFGGKVEG